MSKHAKVVFLAAALLFLGACGGGGGQVAGTGGMGGTGVQVVSNGVMTRGSVIVNGVRYEDTTASISIDDTPKIAANLQDGMVVSVRGSIDDSGRNGTAQQVNAIIEVRGLVTSKDAVTIPQRFVVFGQTVIVDDLTVYSDITFASIVENTTIVEVHGLRDAEGNIRATRVEARQISLPDGTGMANPLVDEIRGVVSGGAGGPNPATFNLGGQPVIAVAGVEIVGGPYQDGSVVEVHCVRISGCIVNGVFQASRIEVEDGSNLPGNGVRFEAEGLVSILTPVPLPGDPPSALTFNVAGVPVSASTSTRYEGGIYSDMRNDIRVEAEGTWNGNVLVANKIEFKRSVIRLQGAVLANPAPTASTFTLQIGDPAVARNVLIERDVFTQGGVPAVGLSCVQVRGQRKAGGGFVVTAGEINTNCSNGGDHALQAPIDAKADPELTLLDFTVNVSGAEFHDLNDNVVTDRAVFFGLISAADPTALPPIAGTLVRVRFDSNNLSVVSEVELED